MFFKVDNTEYRGVYKGVEMIPAHVGSETHPLFCTSLLLLSQQQ